MASKNDIPTLTIQDMIDKARQYVAEGLTEEDAIKKAIEDSKTFDVKREIKSHNYRVPSQQIRGK